MISQTPAIIIEFIFVKKVQGNSANTTFKPVRDDWISHQFSLTGHVDSLWPHGTAACNRQFSESLAWIISRWYCQPSHPLLIPCPARPSIFPSIRDNFPMERAQEMTGFQLRHRSSSERRYNLTSIWISPPSELKVFPHHWFENIFSTQHLLLWSCCSVFLSQCISVFLQGISKPERSQGDSLPAEPARESPQLSCTQSTLHIPAWLKSHVAFLDRWAFVTNLSALQYAV